MSKKPKVDHDYDKDKDKLTITIHRYSLKRKKLARPSLKS